MAATIERRLLVNYRVDPEVIAPLLPAGLRPQLVRGSAVAGVCLIRLGQFRPRGVTPRIGHRSESAAHRIAVAWDGPDGPRTGVYIPRRFPGVHEPADIVSTESAARIGVVVDAADLQVDVELDVVAPPQFRSDLFPDLTSASEFFRKDAVGWSPTRSGRLEALRLDAHDAWHVDPGQATRVRSSFFDALPAGAAAFDHVLVMRGVPVLWSRPADAAPGSLVVG